MFCKYCGAQLPNGAVMCPKCGKPTGEAAAPVQHTVQQGGMGYQTGGRAPRTQQRSCLPRLLMMVLLVVVVIVGFNLIFGGLFASDGDYDTNYQYSDTQYGSGNAGGDQTVSVSQYGTGVYGTDLTGMPFRENYTQLKGNGEDTVTVMVYMVGSNLESESGCATMDLQEMLSATQGDKMNVVVQTGGASYWHNNVMSAGEVQRWSIKDGGIEKLDDLGSQSMLTSDSVADFIGFSAKKYPADRYMLIFWDHGGGSLYGYGSDELFPDDVMTLPDIAEALKTAGVKFDAVGFDACLMGSLETAYMLQPYADYLIASEETEPGYGWDYTGWMTYLGANTSADTVDVGVHIIDEFVAENSKEDTLSIVALREVPHVYDTLSSYLSGAEKNLTRAEFNQLSTARANAKSFADGEFDMIDIVDFTQQAGINGADDLVAAVNSAVKYRTASTVQGTNGLSMYFPYKQLKVYSYAKDYFSTFGFGGSCYQFYDQFVSIMAGGQTRSNASTLATRLGAAQSETPDYSDQTWYDAAAADSDAAETQIDFSALQFVQSGDQWILKIPDADWDLITSVEQQVMLDDGEGYIDLGADQTFETDDDGNLLASFDNTWVALDGQLAPYYAEKTLTLDNGDYAFSGYVPAQLNGKREIEIVLKWDSSDADAGYVAGYRDAGGNSSIGDGGTEGKGLVLFSEGDKIQLECDYYTYDGNYDASYLLGDEITVGKQQPAVTYEDVGEGSVLYGFLITDIYQNQSSTDMVELS